MMDTVNAMGPNLGAVSDTRHGAILLGRFLFGLGDAAAPPRDSDLTRVPGRNGLLNGELLVALRDQLAWGRSRYDRYGPVSWFNLVGRRGILALGPDAAETVFMNHDKAFGTKDAFEFATGPFSRRGLLMLEFDEHMQHRRIMQQAFTRTRLEGYLAAMNPVIHEQISQWPSGRRLMLPTIKNLSLDLAGRVFFGDDLTPLELQTITKCFEACLAAAAAPVRFAVPGLAWSKGLAARHALEEVVRSRLAVKRAANGTDLFAAMCHSMSDEGRTFTDEDIVNHMLFVLFAAHDTSTSAMTTMIYHLAQNPEWRERARAESLAIGKQFLDYADLDRMPTVELVMKEALRLVPPVSFVMRTAVADTQICGRFVPKGSFVLVLPQFNQNMTEYWSEPCKFDPGRFTGERREDRVHRFSWTPFGAGVHKCIGMYFAGMEIKSIMHRMLLDFEWSVDPGYRLKINYHRLPVPSDGLPVRLSRRTHPGHRVTA